MSLPIDEATPAPEELDALLRLLDDETPEVRETVAQRLALFGGDISERLAAQPRALSRREHEVLVEMLGRPRREALEREWLVPTGGAPALREDWESFEALLRVLSDFLHDGVTLRLALSDALDLLAEEAAENGVSSASYLREFLFEEDRLSGNQERERDPRNSDLAWSIAEGRSDPLGLGVIFILVARRMGFEVEGVDFPGHFLCRIFEDGHSMIVDCQDHGRLHSLSELLENPDLNRAERVILGLDADPGVILLRLLENLSAALDDDSRMEDAVLVRKLRATLE